MKYPFKRRDSPPKGKPLGKCPECGGNIYEKGPRYVCEKRRWNHDEGKPKGCSFALWKSGKAIRGRLTAQAIHALLAGHPASVFYTGRISRRKLEAMLILRRDTQQKWTLLPYRKENNMSLQARE